MRPTVFLIMLILCGCKDRIQDDFTLAWAEYRPVHVAGTDNLSR